MTIYKLLAARKAALTKDEFETTTAYQLRAERELARPLTAQLAISDVLAFQSEKYNLGVTYNADLKILKVVAKSDQPTEGFERNNAEKRCFKVKTIFEAERTYVAANALGAQARVTVHDSHSYGISFSNFRNFDMQKYLGEEELKFAREDEIADFVMSVSAKDAIIESLKLDASAAKRAKENLRALFICKLVPPFTSSGTGYKQATLDSPVEQTRNYHYLTVELMEVWFYDITTGQVFAKQKAQTRQPVGEAATTATLPPQPSTEPTPTPVEPASPVGRAVTGRIVSKPVPAYPAEAKKARASGMVVVRVEIDEQGNVISATAISGHPLLQPAAIEAARQAKFEPSLRAGKPVKATQTLTYNFSLW
jgi:TonB family protein